MPFTPAANPTPMAMKIGRVSAGLFKVWRNRTPANNTSQGKGQGQAVLNDKDNPCYRNGQNEHGFKQGLVIIAALVDLQIPHFQLCCP